MDTIFFVLRKKYNQVTFLHIFHHGIMPLGCCLGLKFHPVTYSGFMPLINAFIHSLMYVAFRLPRAEVVLCENLDSSDIPVTKY